MRLGEWLIDRFSQVVTPLRRLRSGWMRLRFDESANAYITEGIKIVATAIAPPTPSVITIVSGGQNVPPPNSKDMKPPMVGKVVEMTCRPVDITSRQRRSVNGTRIDITPVWSVPVLVQSNRQDSGLSKNRRRAKHLCARYQNPPPGIVKTRHGA